MGPVLPSRAGRAAACASCASTDGGVEAGRFCMGAPHVKHIAVYPEGSNCRAAQLLADVTNDLKAGRAAHAALARAEPRTMKSDISCQFWMRPRTQQADCRFSERSMGTCMPGRPPTGEGALRGLDAGELASLRVRLRLTGCFALSGSSMRSRPSCVIHQSISARPASAAQHQA